MRQFLLAVCLLLASVCAAAAKMLLGVAGAGVVLPPGMTTPLISGGSDSSPSTSAAGYLPIASGWSTTYATSYTGAQQSIPLAGTISNLTVKLTTAATTGSWTIALGDNGTATSLTCTISTGTTCPSPVPGPVSVAAGDQLTWIITPTSTPTAQPPPPGIMMTALFTANAGVNQGPILMSSVGAVANNATNYIGPGGGYAAGTSEIAVSGIIPVAGVVEGFYAAVASTPGTAGTKYYTFIVEHNGVDSPITCQVNNPSASTACNDTVHSFSVAAGDTVSCKITPTGTPTARVANCGVLWQPTTSGQSLVFNNESPGRPALNATNYFDAAGFSVAGTTETSLQQMAPTLNSGHTLTFGNLEAAQNALAIGGRSVTLRANAASPSSGPSCSISTSGGITVGGVSGTAACADTTDTYQITSSLQPLLDMMTADSGVGTALTWFKSTMTAVYQ